MRRDGRKPDELRPIEFTRRYTEQPAGSVLARAGRTVVLCTACVEDGVPPFLLNSNKGWLTAEYGMLPGSTGNRKARDGRRGPSDGRSIEIGRFIGRSLRAVCELSRFPGRTIWVDCDVLQADGGTRTLAISGSMVALHDACKYMEKKGWLRGWPLRSNLAAISVGLHAGEPLLDLDYREDSGADADINVVMNSAGELVELQGGGEKTTFSQERLGDLLGLARIGVEQVLALQNQALEQTS